MNKEITPSVVRFRGSLKESAELLNTVGCECVHLDIIAGGLIGDFLSYEDFTPEVREWFDGAVDLHLFELQRVKSYHKLPLRTGDCVIYHVFPWMESNNVTTTLRDLKRRNIKTGVALDLETPIEVILAHLDAVDTILVMGIEVGGKRLTLDARAIPSLLRIRATAKIKRQEVRLGIDGGVNAMTCEKLVQLVDFLVVGSLLFEATHPKSQWVKLKTLTQRNECNICS